MEKKERNPYRIEDVKMVDRYSPQPRHHAHMRKNLVRSFNCKTRTQQGLIELVQADSISARDCESEELVATGPQSLVVLLGGTFQYVSTYMQTVLSRD